MDPAGFPGVLAGSFSRLARQIGIMHAISLGVWNDDCLHLKQMPLLMRSCLLGSVTARYSFR